MNSAIFSFRKFEEASLDYVGGGTKFDKIGLFDSTISSKESIAIIYNSFTYKNLI